MNLSRCKGGRGWLYHEWPHPVRRCRTPHAAFKFTFKAFVFKRTYLTEDQESVLSGRSEVAVMLDKIRSVCLKVLQPGSEICVSWRTVDVVPSCCGKWHADCTESLRSCLMRSRIRFLASLQTQHSERSNTRGRGRGKGTGEEGWGWEWCGGQILA